MLGNLFSSKISLLGGGGVGTSGSLETSSSQNMIWQCPLWIYDPHFLDSYNDVVPWLLVWSMTKPIYRWYSDRFITHYQIIEIVELFSLWFSANGVYWHHHCSRVFYSLMLIIICHTTICSLHHMFSLNLVVVVFLMVSILCKVTSS